MTGCWLSGLDRTVTVAAKTPALPGPMAEWLRRGLQILARRFDSGSGLHIPPVRTRTVAVRYRTGAAPAPPFTLAGLEPSDHHQAHNVARTVPMSEQDMTDSASPAPNLKRIRVLLWVIVALAIVGGAALALLRGSPSAPESSAAAQSSFGGPFTLVGADGKPFSSAKLSAKPYAIYFGFTRCADVCPTTLSRLVKLRNESGGENAFNIVFVTIDPEHDGPKEVGQYAGLFNSPIIGLTGSQAQIDQAKKQYGIYAQPSAHPMAGKEMEHSAIVLLFDRNGKFVATVSPDDPH